MVDIFTKRRSIRTFEDREVETEKLEAILTAAQMAPSWANMQCWELIVVTDGELRAGLSELLSPKNPATLCTRDAPVVIAVAGTVQRSGYYKGEQVTRYPHWFMYDLGLVSQNICLKACELGLGSVIVGFFDHRRAEEILQIPAGVELVALIPIGYPRKQPSAPKRREVSDFVHYNTY